MVNYLFSLLVLLSAIYFVAAQQRVSNTISQGSYLTPTGNSSWLSPSGLFAFGFYPQGDNRYGIGIFIAGLSLNKTVVWTANRDNPPVSKDVTLRLTTDGRLILQQQSADSTTDVLNVDQSISSASMLDTGNFVMYDSYQNKIWQSFDQPTDTILPGQCLFNDRNLFSSKSETNYSTGIFRLNMQSDSNLVQYPVETTTVTSAHAYWSTATFGRGVNVTLNLDPDGHLYLLNNSVAIILNLTGGYSKTRRLYLAKLDFDGIFRLYSLSLDKGHNSSVVWESSHDKCDPKGLCGLNGYCTLDDNEVKCLCLPGFNYVSPGDRTAGCEKNNTAYSCKNKEGRIQYSMRPVENTWWEDDPYSVLKMNIKDDCEAACLEDCNCEAAFFKDGECKKQRLPLRYGRRSPSESNIAYIKWASPEPEKEAPTDLRTKKRKEPARRGILIIGVSLVALAFTVFMISGFVVYRNRARAGKKILVNGNYELLEDIGPRSFTYAELEKVTNGFQEEIGRGSSGTVYKGMLNSNNQAVAVKRLGNMLAEGDREFQNEMKVIGRTHHRNLVRLLGYSLDGPNKLLIYEYMVNGSLADVLFDSQHPPRWDERIRIALEIARGILYLHEECETQIIHCDIKPQNILIDENRSAKISDFGLAKLLKADQTNTYTGIRGTRGYVAPEWHRKMAVTVKVDVYSFGIMLLEILCCRKSVEPSVSEEEAVLEEWVYQCYENNELAKLIIDVETDKDFFERMVRVGLWCILDEPSLRPSMKKVLLMLEGTVDIPAPPYVTSFLTAI